MDTDRATFSVRREGQGEGRCVFLTIHPCFLTFDTITLVEREGGSKHFFFSPLPL